MVTNDDIKFCHQQLLTKESHCHFDCFPWSVAKTVSWSDIFGSQTKTSAERLQLFPRLTWLGMDFNRTNLVFYLVDRYSFLESYVNYHQFTLFFYIFGHVRDKRYLFPATTSTTVLPRCRYVSERGHKSLFIYSGHNTVYCIKTERQLYTKLNGKKFFWTRR